MTRTLELGLYGILGGVAGLAAKRVAGELAQRVLPSSGDYTKLAGHPPSAKAKKVLGTAIHWGFGATMAAAYAMLRRERRGLDLRGGLVFALLVWGLVDEVGISLLGLQDAPTAYPRTSHVNALAQHLAYGTAFAATTQRLASM